MFNLILPMCGYGQRFKAAGYKAEKPLIRVGGKSLLHWSLECVPARTNVTAILRADQPIVDISNELSMSFMLGKMRTLILPGPTAGAACTVLAAAVGLPADEPVAVMNCDQWFSLNWDMVLDQASAELWDGFILTFPGEGPAWSYAVTNGEDRVVWVVEKKAVSKYATVGFYYWRRCSDLIKSVCGMIASGQRTNNEYYLAPSFNFLPLADRDVRIVPVKAFAGLGTPEQVQSFDAASMVEEP